MNFRKLIHFAILCNRAMIKSPRLIMFFFIHAKKMGTIFLDFFNVILPENWILLTFLQVHNPARVSVQSK